MSAMIENISAITLATHDMARAVRFYRMLGFEVIYGGDDAAFTSFRAGTSYLNLIAQPAERMWSWWGRVARNEAAHAANGIFDAALLPRRIGIAEEGLNIDAMEPMMELGAVVEGDDRDSATNNSLATITAWPVGTMEGRAQGEVRAAG